MSEYITKDQAVTLAENALTVPSGEYYGPLRSETHALCIAAMQKGSV